MLSVYCHTLKKISYNQEKKIYENVILLGDRCRTVYSVEFLDEKKNSNNYAVSKRVFGFI